jgi:hypothetical protein
MNGELVAQSSAQIGVFWLYNRRLLLHSLQLSTYPSTVDVTNDCSIFSSMISRVREAHSARVDSTCPFLTQRIPIQTVCISYCRKQCMSAAHL